MVYRLKGPIGIKDPWIKRIVELANGATVGDVTRTLYLGGIKSGASGAHIGMWRKEFDQSVFKAMSELVKQGYLGIGSPETAWEERNGAISQTKKVRDTKSPKGEQW